MERWFRAKYQPNLPLYEGKPRVTASPEHILLSKNVAKEGMVLLKNRDANGAPVLPLRQGAKVALFGKGTFDYVKGGGGSGDVNTPFVHNLYDGLSALKDEVSVWPESVDFYREYVQDQYQKGGLPGLIPEPAVDNELIWRAAAYTDTAIVSISRFSGEGWDRKSSLGGPEESSEKWVAETSRMQNKLFPRSDFYLTPAEENLMNQLQANFAKVIVVMNVGGMVDTTWFHDNDNIAAVLMAWQGGMEGGTAAAELLMGHGSPAGKLADTLARELEDYPSTAGFHEAMDHVDYTEDIYVGYRYFETLPGAAAKVNYPFGFGLSYTQFDMRTEGAEVRTYPAGRKDNAAASASGQAAGENAEETDSERQHPAEHLYFRIRVENIGQKAGREVVQVYCGAPQGQLGKPARVLVGFQKTRLLQPGETQLILIEVPVEALASYDDTGRICRSAYVLEKGSYHFFIGDNVRDAADLSPLFQYEVPENRVVLRLTSRLAPTQLSRRLRADGSFEELPQGAPADPNENAFTPLTDAEAEGVAPAVRAVPRSKRPSSDDPDHVRLPQLSDVAEGKLSLDDFAAALPDDILIHLLGGQPNTGVANTYGFGNVPEYGIPNVMTADGPAGLRVNKETGVATTAFPCATLLACTWDPDVTYAVGRAGGEEVAENNISVWLTPAVNIHRSPLCGRNFEYYSEDPLLAGRQASGMVRGIQSTGVAACVKHFALNNKETNRKDSDSRCSERAIREIYLKQFEIIVREAHPWSIMTSYNIINGHRASENNDLIEGILRGEWGFDGLVSTDWWNHAEQYKECLAGNDVKMGTGFPERLQTALDQGLITRADLEKAARNVLQLILRVQ